MIATFQTSNRRDAKQSIGGNSKMNSQVHFEAGQLGDAVEACAAELRQEPTNARRRFFFAELLCFQGEWERADKQLEMLQQQDPKHAVHTTLLRQLIRAEMARHEVFTQGRVPDFIVEPSPSLVLHLRALVSLRDGDVQAAKALLADAESQRAAVGGYCDGTQFDDIRDLDDLTAAFLEIVTAAGQYYWLPFELVSSLDFSPPKRPRDLLWRPVHLELHGKPSIDGFVPTLYVGSSESGHDELRLGRATKWSDADAGPVRGSGLRMVLLGEEDKTILEIGSIRFGLDG
jgi:type VI secretion system protein ImpE